MDFLKQKMNRTPDEIPNTTIKELTVVITGGNLRDGEYMVRRMTPEQIYETLRDGFTVTASGFQK